MLVGGQMVAVLEAEFGGIVGRTTTDVDIVVGVNGVCSSPRVAAQRLVEVGYEPSRETEATYRFVRGSDTVDVMAPDHLGERADIVTVPPGETIEAPGGRQALQRKRTVTVSAKKHHVRSAGPVARGGYRDEGPCRHLTVADDSRPP